MKVGQVVIFGVLLGAASTGPTTAASPSLAPATTNAKATFAGGCFWCMEPPFEKLPGVISVTSGYTGGPEKNPSYEQVSSSRTGHAESVAILYDPAKIGYQKLLDVFWHNIDPTQANGQFCDRGAQYRSAIYTRGPEQKRLAERSKIEVANRLRRPIVTQIVAAGPFYAAERYHQDFYKKDPERYTSYRAGCGRDRRLAELWGKPQAQAH